MVAKVLRQNLVTLVDTYAKATGTTKQTVSRRFYGNVGFIKSFRARKATISIDKYDEIVRKMQKMWPRDAEWPFLRPAIISAPKKIIPK